MFAIIKTGGKQLKVQPGDEIYVEKLNLNEGEQVLFKEVLMMDSTFGNPLIKNAVVSGTIVKQGKEKKLRVIRYHPKKNVNKVYGHRQPYTKVKIDELSLTGVLSNKPKPAKVQENKIENSEPKLTSTTAKPAATKTTAAKSTTAKPAATKTTAAKSTTAKPAATKTTAAKSTTAKPAATKTTAAKSTTAKPKKEDK
ncbi:50S ribosomal protein L21 [Spiroplasma litorale]|uniref:Large ribosomal subunit protein bL21 n=1 Tax=Spiroplasma litorale TaxID=216942 RepID=A0A0K1W2D0_9MOLU|nr:50S ribosomal protein L21 [Spiroplasma litorale]